MRLWGWPALQLLSSPRQAWESAREQLNLESCFIREKENAELGAEQQPQPSRALHKFRPVAGLRFYVC